MNFWRNDGLDPRGYPTVSSVHVCAEDTVKQHSIYTLKIVHLVSLRGKGFMPSVRGGSFINGSVHLGEDSAAYELAVKEGEDLLREKVEDLDRLVRDYEANLRK